MITELEFSKRYVSEIPIFKAWGKFVNDQIKKSLIRELGEVEKVNLFLKIPPEPRTKDINSIISKAYYRNKNYTDAYNDITDKVGVRYVVLLVKDINIISNIIVKCPLWKNSKDRDFEEEKLKNPLVFDYQSVHYIVTNVNEFIVDGLIIPVDTPCEIQIRTILQHAYAELTHDTIYKPKTKATPDIQRLIAKSMALIETTDDIFSNVEEELRKSDKEFNNVIEKLEGLYKVFAPEDFEKNMNLFILDAYRDLLNKIDLKDVDKFIRETKSLQGIINKKRNELLLYRQPIVLLLMYLVVHQRNDCKNLWPLTDFELRPLFTDLGVAYEIDS